MMKHFLTVLFLFSSFACTTDKQRERERVSNVILTAKILLTRNACNEAIQVVDGTANPGINADFIRTRASAYACRSGYRTPTFFSSDLKKIVGKLNGFLSSLTTFSTSEMKSPVDSHYLDLQQAINILLNAGNVTYPSSAERAKVFTKEELSDINIFALYMVMVEFGKYLYYYGNVNPVTGEKGAGSINNGNPNFFTNGCIYNYDPTQQNLANLFNYQRFQGKLNSCTLTATGNPKLPPLPDANTIQRMCEGIVLFNQLMDLIANISIPGAETALAQVQTQFSGLCAQASLGDLCLVLSVNQCVSDYSVLGTLTDKLQTYIFAIFESNF